MANLQIPSPSNDKRPTNVYEWLGLIQKIMKETKGIDWHLQNTLNIKQLGDSIGNDRNFVQTVDNKIAESHKPVELASTADLNTLTETGLFSGGYDGDGSKILNRPNISGSFILRVYKVKDIANGPRVIQILYCRLTGDSYTRIHGEIDGWSEWIRTLRETDASVNADANKLVIRDSNGNIKVNSITGVLQGNASSATKLQTARKINGTNFDGTQDIITSQWGTARTLTIGNSGKSVNGSANVSWSLSEIGAAPISHNHGLLHDNFTVTLPNTPTDNGWSMINSSYNGFILKSIRTEESAPSWILNNYAAGIAFGGSDTKGVISMAYTTPRLRFAGGNGSSPRWYFTINGGQSQIYDLEDLRTATNSNAANKIVKRDANGNFSAGTITATLAGNASSSTKLQTSRTINGTAFDGTGNITTANWGTARTLTIGNSGKSVNGSGNVSWSLSEIGAAAASHNHGFLDLKNTNTISGTSNDTVANWSREKNSVHYFNTTGKLIDQPSQYGFVLNLTNGGTEVHQIWATQASGNLAHRGGNSSGWSGTWRIILDSSNYNSYAPTKTGGGASGSWGISVTGNAATATKLQTARTINGTNFDGTSNITTANWGTSRNIQIGNSSKSVNGSGNVTWSHSEMGVLPTSGGTMTGSIRFSGGGYSGVAIQMEAGDSNGAYIGIGAGGLTVIGSGESTATVRSNQSNAADEKMIVASDSDITFHVGLQNGYGSRKTVTITSAGVVDSPQGFKGALNGNASTATKLATARTIEISGAMRGSVSFDGSSNVKLTTDRQSISVGTESGDITRWYLVASKTMLAHNDTIVTFSVNTTYGVYAGGILRLHVRSNSSAEHERMELDWLVNTGLETDDFAIVYTNTTWKLFAKTTTRWRYLNFTVLAMNYRTQSSAEAVDIPTTLQSFEALPQGTVKYSRLALNQNPSAQANKLNSFYSRRQSSLDIAAVGDGSLTTFKATTENHNHSSYPGKDGHILHFEWDNDAGWSSQLFLGASSDYPIIKTRAMKNHAWGEWNTFYSTHNKPTPSEIGAAPSSHTHTSAQISDATASNNANTVVKRDGNGNFSAGTITATLNGTANYSKWLTPDSRMEYGWNGVNYFNVSGTAGNAAKVNDTPTTAWWHIMRFNHQNTAGFYTDLAIPFNTTSLYYKRITSGAVQNGGWVKVLDKLNYNEFVPTKTGGGASGSWGISVTGNAATATKLQTARSINGTNFDGTGNITTANWGTARTITIGNSGKSVNGSGNVSWSLSEIGAAASNHSHNSIASRGQVTCETGTTKPAVTGGLSMTEAYNNGYPVSYGNVLTMSTGSGGSTQLFLEWNGTSGATGRAYIRNKRDMSDAAWSSWSQIYTSTHKPSASDIGAAAASHTHTSAQISDATASNNANTVVKRDGSGNFNTGRITLSNWIYCTGNTGIYFNTHGGGWYMTDTTWVRAYGDKSIYTKKDIKADGKLIGGSAQISGAMTASGWVSGSGFTSGGGWYEVNSGEAMKLRSGSSNFILLPKEGLTLVQLYPNSNNGGNLGTDGFRWSKVYTVNGVSQSSDVRYKTNIETVDTFECFNMIKNIDVYTYILLGENKEKLSGVQLKNTTEKNKNNIEIGVIAQDIAKFKYGKYIVSMAEKEENKESFYDISPYNLTSATIAALKEEINLRESLESEVSSLNNKVETLESEIEELKSLVTQLLNK